VLNVYKDNKVAGLSSIAKQDAALLHRMWQGERDADNSMRHDQPTGKALVPNAELTSLLDSLPEALIFLNKAAMIQYANARAATVLGIDKLELIGTMLWQYAPYLVTTTFYQVLLTATRTREPLEVEYRSPLTQTWLRMRLLPTDEGFAVFASEGTESMRSRDPLHQSEQRYQDLLESLSDHVVILTPQGLVLEINEPPLVGAGVRREEVIGKCLIDLPVWSLASAAQEQLRAAVEQASGGETVHFEIRIRPQAEKYLDLALTITPSCDIYQQVEYLICTGIDITESKRAEESLRVLVESIPQFVWISKPAGSIIYSNQRWRDYLAKTAEQAHGYRWKESLHADDQQRILDVRQNAVKTGEPYEIEYRLRDGTSGEYRWFLARATPLKDDQGRILQWFGTSTDIDEQKRTEEALRQSQERVHMLMASNVIGIFMTQGDEIIEANDTFLRMIGYSREDLEQGRLNWINITAPEYMTATEQYHHELRLHEYVAPYEKEYVLKDGNRLAVLVGGIITQLDPLETICFVLDNSVRKELEQRKDDFLSMASHELRTPLTSLKLQTQILKKRLMKQNVPTAEASLVRMEAQITTVTRLIEELFDLSKIQAGKLEYAQETVNLNTLLREIVEVMQQTQKTHTIIMPDIGHSFFLEGDRDRLGQVFLNLISNAIKYSPDADQVEVDIKTSPEAVTISVRDYGIGIPQKQQARIFERFYRAVAPNQSAFPGLGMGLYIVETIVKHHGGTITLESKMGAGSIFQVTLPRKVC
jgi:PAS domain S-box-containing protein